MAQGSSSSDGSRVEADEGRGRTPLREPAPPVPSRAGPARTLKHVLDRVVGFLGLVLTSPLFLLVALVLVVRRTPSVLTTQTRLGDRGPFPLASFTVPDPHSLGGRVLVGSGLVALPQLFSLLRGDLSLIGPRPRHEGEPPPPCRPGVVGLAQNAQARREISRPEQYSMDAQYAAEWSLALDARILGRCVWDAIVPPR